ncbi:nucleotide-sugar transporter-domain-containing protein [Dissophora ornata]|nr:nucleotide-sugar transporter-domain-containing protein [Dissophora ornata]
MTVLHSLWTGITSVGLTFLLGFLLCIFQSSESILVKLAGNRPDPHPSSTKLLFLSELLKLLVSYSLLCVERKQLVGVSAIFRRRCCRSKSSSCCRSSSRETLHEHQPIPLQDDEESQPLTSKHQLDEYDEEDQIESPSSPAPTQTLSPSLPSHLPPTSSATQPPSSCGFPPILFFAVPGAIYFFNNNLTFVLLSLMPAPTYVVLSNLKILTTGLFSYWFLNRLLTTPQWVSLGILFLSTAVSQVDLEKGLSLSISIQAFLLMVLFCSLSAAASVFSEYVMKERFAGESIHSQNMKLYMFGILFNGITYLLSSAPRGESTAMPVAGTTTGFFSDIAPIHIMIIIAYASLGLVTSAIIKFSGSITKVYASSMSMFFAALVSWLLLNDQLTVLFFVGCFGCCFALHLYYRAPATTTLAPYMTAAAEDDDEAGEETRREGEEIRRNSTSSSGSSTTLTASPTSKAKLSPNKLTSVKVVDRKEYFSLESLEHNSNDDTEGGNQERGSGTKR